MQDFNLTLLFRGHFNKFDFFGIVIHLRLPYYKIYRCHILAFWLITVNGIRTMKRKTGQYITISSVGELAGIYSRAFAPKARVVN